MNTALIDENLVRETLRQVIDPEIRCNIVDLGLVYGVTIEGDRVSVQMTLTTPGCPMQESIAWGVKMALLNYDAIQDVDVEIVWDPPWNASMMSDIGRAHVGIR